MTTLLQDAFEALAACQGIPVTVGTETLMGVYRNSTISEPLTGKKYAPELMNSPSVLLPTLPGLGIKDPITVNGKPMRIRDYDAVGDGSVTRYFLQEAPR